jgi:hypothetical protein
MQDISTTRQVDKTWMEDGRKKVMIYKIGLDDEGWSQWDNDEKKLMGWGMKISIDNEGNISGANLNSGEMLATAKRKEYIGKLENGVLRINVIFPDTGQENYYEGKIVTEGDQSIFRGRFILTKTVGTRQVGTGGIMEGIVHST